MNKNNNKAILFALAGLIAISLHSSRIDDRLREIKNSTVSSSVDIYQIYKELSNLALDKHQRDILKKYIESLEANENKEFGLNNINVLTITNKTGEKKSYLITESNSESRDNDGRTYDDFSFSPYEKYFDDLPSFYVTRVEMITYSRIGNNSVTPFIFKTKVSANDKQLAYQGSYTSITSIFGNFYTRHICQGPEHLLEEYSYEIIDSEFETEINPLSEVLGTNDSRLSFSLEELNDIEEMINEKHSLSLS